MSIFNEDHLIFASNTENINEVSQNRNVKELFFQKDYLLTKSNQSMLELTLQQFSIDNMILKYN